YKPPPNEIDGVFPGRSAIVDSDGAVLESMDDKEGVGVAEVTLDPARKTRLTRVCSGVGIADLRVGGQAGAAAVADEYARAQEVYERDAARKAKARAMAANAD